VTQLDLTLSGADKTKIQTGLAKLKEHLDQRKEVWNRIPPEKCKAWIVSDKDDVMSLAWNVFKYLDSNFFARKEELE